MEIVKIELMEGGYKPIKAHKSDAGYDLRACLQEEIIIKPQETQLISTGIKLELPEGYVGYICSRSGNALKRKIIVANAPGIIDSSYRGILGVILLNTGKEEVIIKDGEKIAQLLIDKLPDIEIIYDKVNEDTERGDSGFGSSGR